MRSRQFSLRGAIYSLVLFISGLLAHFLACGAFISPFRFILEGTFVLALVFFLIEDDLEGPRLALLSLVSQAAVHSLLGGMVMNTNRMLLWHTFFAGATYVAIRYGEVFWRGGLSSALPLISLRFSPTSIFAEQLCRITQHIEEFNEIWIDRRAHSLRAPPINGV